MSPREKARAKRMRNTTEMVLTIIAFAIFIWFIASWINVCNHNMTDFAYAKWNLITMLWR